MEGDIEVIYISKSTGEVTLQGFDICKAGVCDKQCGTCKLIYCG